MAPGETRDGIPAVELLSLPEQEKLLGHELILEDGVPAVELPALLEQEKSIGRVVPPGKTREGVPVVKLPLTEQEKSMGHEMPVEETRDGAPMVEVLSLLEQEKPMGNEMSCGETRAAGPVVEIPSSPQEEKPKVDLLFLLEKARKPHFQKDDSLKLREHLLNAASVLKFKLVTRVVGGFS